MPVHLKIPLFKLAILNTGEAYQGKLRLLVATRDAAGGISPVRQVEVPLDIPRKEVLYRPRPVLLYTLTLKMTPGEQQSPWPCATSSTAATSYLSRAGGRWGGRGGCQTIERTILPKTPPRSSAL